MQNVRQNIKQQFIDAIISTDKKRLLWLLFLYHPKYNIGSPHFTAWLKSDEAIKIMEKLEQEY